MQNHVDEDARLFGLLGKVVGTLNAAKDTAYVMYEAL